MPRAEAGSMKDLSNKMKSKGLQRLRWYCQACEKQCRDANGFKCHVNSESHQRQMQVVGEDSRKYINGFSNDFQRDFVALLRTAHGEKWIGANRFYNEYIRDKEHIHMNATKWASLTEFVKFLGRESIVHVKEDEKDGLMISWRDTSLGALKRKQEIAQKEAMEARAEAGGDRMLMKMAKRAKEEAAAKAKAEEAKKAQEKSLPSPPAEEKTSEAAPVEQAPSQEQEAASATATAPAPAPAPAKPVKIGFTFKNAVPAMSQPKKSSKRSREGGEEKARKKAHI
ncbi:hypothetical protein EJ04DRAFT_517121 [Polyplosphaeria fusca]|uniref:C2H2-type domain-containing protein n=1 Tax=Polyplosphaeria fusca TaxID=682080 RepID=A0A9P4UUY4_9PLEO|nr:hypothetical protein EJ04DRAFT_517121 [Polyplosphaeria fusca]